MKIERILAGIREAQSTEKKASETAPATSSAEKTSSSSPALLSALNDALAGAEKTASVATEASPVDDVMKVAADLARMEKEAAEKEARTLGTAFADAAVARLEEWNKAAAELMASQPAPAAPFGKFASENPDLVKQAAQLGYEQAKAELEKQAAESYTQGYNDTVEQIHKVASAEFLKGAAATSDLLQAVASAS